MKSITLCTLCVSIITHTAFASAKISNTKTVKDDLTPTIECSRELYEDLYALQHKYAVKLLTESANRTASGYEIQQIEGDLHRINFYKANCENSRNSKQN